MEVTEEGLESFFSFMSPLLDERQLRLLAGATARMLGRGGPTVVAKASGMSRNTVIDGTKEYDSGAGPSDRVRREGGGPPRLIDNDPDLLVDLDDLVEPDSRGDPMSPLRWTLKSTRQLAKALCDMGHQISYRTVGPLLHEMGYSLQATAKTVEGAQHPDRNAQFEHISAAAKAFLAADQPVVSVDCKKKELVGEVPGYKNAGREWQPEGKPNKAGVHDFPDKDMPKAVISTGVTLLIVLAIAIPPSLGDDGPTTYDVGVVGGDAAPLVDALKRTDVGGDVKVRTRVVPRGAAAERLVKDGTLDAAVTATR